MCYKINKNLINKKTKELSYLLKHDETYTFDEENYRDVSDLIDNHGFTYPILEEIIRLSKKDVFEFSELPPPKGGGFLLQRYHMQ